MKSILAVFVLSGLWLAAVAAGPLSQPPSPSSPAPTPTHTPTPSETGTPTPRPTPAPTPTPTPASQAWIQLDQAAGQPGMPLVVTGSGFPSGQPVTIYLDASNQPLGPQVFPQDGSFQQQVTIPAGASAGDHRICAAGPGGPACARFQVQAVATAAPTPVPTAGVVGGPTPAATPNQSPSAAAGTQTGTGTPLGSSSALSTLFPWVLIPIALLLALGALAVWLLKRGTAAPDKAARKFGPAGGSGIPTITHRSPGPVGGPAAGARTVKPSPDGPVTVEWLPADPPPIEPQPAGAPTVEWLPAGAPPIESRPAGLSPSASPPPGLPPAPQSETISPATPPGEPVGEGAEPGPDDDGSALSGVPIITHHSPQPFGELPDVEPSPPTGEGKPSGDGEDRPRPPR